MIKNTLLAAAATTVLFTPAQAAVMWNFNYTDAGVGFNDPTNGAARRAALASAGDYLSTFLTSYTATIEMSVNGAETDDTTLASAGSEFSAPTTTGFANRGDVMTKILFGDAADPNPGAADGKVNWNFEDHQWELGNDFQAGEFDFFSTAVHELTHALGWASDITDMGVAISGPKMWNPFDQFVGDATGVSIVDATTLEPDLTRWGAASIAGGNCGVGLTFNGANAVAANGGNPVELYSPGSWENGSSGSHLDDACYMGTYMMEAASDTGLGLRTLSAVEIGVLKDIGYTNFGVTNNPGGGGNIPTPPALYLLLAGLGMLGFKRATA